MTINNSHTDKIKLKEFLVRAIRSNNVAAVAASRSAWLAKYDYYSFMSIYKQAYNTVYSKTYNFVEFSTKVL